jgi:hypothetical protein
LALRSQGLRFSVSRGASFIFRDAPNVERRFETRPWVLDGFGTSFAVMRAGFRYSSYDVAAPGIEKEA